VKLALIFPPACDPTAPYPALPALAGFLRPNGIDVLSIDANLEGFLALLRREPLAELADRIERRSTSLKRRRLLDHQAQLELLTLLRVRGEAQTVPGGIGAALEVLRRPERFFQPGMYADAVATVGAALRVISAAHAPLQLDFTAYRTPFALTTPEEILRDAQPERDPFDGYLARDLVPRLRRAGVDGIGISVCFPGQLVPAYSFALKLKRAFPEAHLVAGGPAITQVLLRLHGPALRQALGPFDSAVVFEGEHTLLALCRALAEGRKGARDLADAHIANLVLPDPALGASYLSGPPAVDLRTLPSPDFDGLPLDRYLSPQLLLPYDPTRGCYWGRCAFCHYGLTATGTARYRERAVETVVEHLGALSARHGTRFFYLSQDSVAPKTLGRLADALAESGLDLRWGTDLRPEAQLTPKRCAGLRRGGAVACSLGVESASPRVLHLIDKGVTPAVASQAMRNLSRAGIAAEVMCFTDFPTETFAEAMATLRFLQEQSAHVAAFIVGRFELTHGSRVAREPAHFGLREIWGVQGDALGTALFFAERKPSKRDRECLQLEQALHRLASGWLLRSYPWAGSLSTAHTIFYYDRFGSGVFRDLASQAGGQILGTAPAKQKSHLNLAKLALAEESEAEIWHELTHVRRQISRQAYAELAARLPPLRRPAESRSGALARRSRPG
jgi:anaerobic magnesium-protoporphyrin IX monomethyl ester cyclase